MINTPAAKITIDYSLNIDKVIYRVTVEHNLRSVFAAMGNPQISGTQGARRGIIKQVRQAIRDQVAQSGSFLGQRHLEKHPRWPGIKWADIEKDVEKAVVKYRKAHP